MVDLHNKSLTKFADFTGQDVEQSIPYRFGEIVRRCPERVAVKTKTGLLTYADLNHQVNRVADVLLASRGRAAEPILLLMNSDLKLFSAILGILKSGKFYVPLDPLHPQARNRHVLEDSGAGVLLTNNRNLSLAEEIARDRADVINVDAIDFDAPAKDVSAIVSADTLAYVIYTSGSTGLPKGVTQNHRNVLHKTMEYTNSWRVCPEDRLALLYSYSTSGAVRDIFGALLNGACLCPFTIREEGMADLSKWLIDEQITIYNSVATVFRHFVAGLTGREIFPNLRLIHVGSETIYKKEVEQYKKYFADDCIFVARYGTSEVSPIRQFVVHKNTKIDGTSVPVGHEVMDTEVLLLDDNGSKVGVNRIGEIAVRSRYLTPGYWRRPELTRKVFVSGPQGADDRIYLTGDLGLMQPDGCLLHLGRKDFQVKIRGHRVEITEIETALLNLGTIKEAAVAAKDDQRLVAYVIPSVRPAPSARALREALLVTLPEYMIPSVFEFVDALPVNATGKLDRRALREPDRTKRTLSNSFVAPVTPTQATLADIWSQVLNVDRIGIDDEFVELGGNSLAAIQLVSRVMTTFGVSISVPPLLAACTVAGMAEQIDVYQWAEKALQCKTNSEQHNWEEGDV